MFDKPTRTAIKINSNNFGDGIAARGAGLNKVIEELRPLVTNAVPVLHNLASPADRAARVLRGAEPGLRGDGAGRPGRTPTTGSTLDKFFTDWASVAKSIEEANTGGPASLEQAIYSLPHQAPFYENATEFMNLLRPSAKSLVKVAPRARDTPSASAPPTSRPPPQLNDAPGSNPPRRWRNSPPTRSPRWASKNSPNTLEDANPLLAGIAPEPGLCNYWTLAFRNVASLELREHRHRHAGPRRLRALADGRQQRGLPRLGARPTGPPKNAMPSPTRSTTRDNNHLHANLYPNTAGPGQPQVCEAGNETYIPEPDAIGQPAGGGRDQQPRIHEPRTEPVRRKVPGNRR